MLSTRLSITDIAQSLGITPKTIMRWERAGRVKRAKRDWRGWRVYSPQDLEEMKALVETLY